MLPLQTRKISDRGVVQKRRRIDDVTAAHTVSFLVSVAAVILYCGVADAFSLTCHYSSRRRRRKVMLLPHDIISSFGLSKPRPFNRHHSITRSFCSTTRLLLNRFLFDPSEVTVMTETSSMNAAEAALPPTDATVNMFPPLPTPPPNVVAPPTVTLPMNDYRTIHAAKILNLQNGDTIRAGIVSCCTNNNNNSSDSTNSAAATRTTTATTTTSAFCTKHGLLTDTATIQWISPAGNEVVDSQPLFQQKNDDNTTPPGLLRIHLHELQEPNLSSSSSSLLGVSLILALPRPLQLGRLLPMIAQMGIDHLVLIHAAKVPRDYFGSHLLRQPHELTNRLVEGLSQAGTDVRLPTVHVIRPGVEYWNFWGKYDHSCDSLLINRLFPEDEYARVVAHPQRVVSVPIEQEGTTAATSTLLLPPPPLRMRNVHFPPSKQQQQQRKLVLAVGPEGGWAEPDELDMLVNDHGFQIVTMGPRVLRSDCAVVSLLALAHDAVAVTAAEAMD